LESDPCNLVEEGKKIRKFEGRRGLARKMSGETIILKGEERMDLSSSGEN
jgi:hypothetical protein